MKIEHIALYTKDLETTKEFFIKYFHVKSNALYHNKNTGFKSYFLSFDEGARLEIMQKPNVTNQIGTLEHIGYAHIALSVGSKEKVDSLTQKLKEDGYEVISGPRMTGDGYYESCIVILENNLLEITA